MDAENLAELYEPWISDPVKYTFRQYGQGAEAEKAALARWPEHYQGAADGAVPIWKLRHG